MGCSPWALPAQGSHGCGRAGLERTAYVLAAATLTAWVVTQVLFPVRYADPPDNLGLRHAALVLVFLVTGLLFRHAGRRVEQDAGSRPQGSQENVTSR